MQHSWQNNHPNHNHSHCRIIQQQQSRHSLIRSIDSNQQAVLAIAAVVGEAVEEDKSTFPAMERMAFEQRVDGVMITTVGHVGLILNTTV
jgi:signal-transduction protein with cAMP-binding, CBS, and nucleotidyltransferase domain